MKVFDIRQWKYIIWNRNIITVVFFFFLYNSLSHKKKCNFFNMFIKQLTLLQTQNELTPVLRGDSIEGAGAVLINGKLIYSHEIGIFR